MQARGNHYGITYTHCLPLYDIFIIIYDGASYEELSGLIGRDCREEG